MNHENIVSCYTSFTIKLQKHWNIEKELWCVLPYFKNGSCADLMRSMERFKYGFKDESIISRIMYDVLKGIDYIHNNDRIHRQIKASNIFLNSNGVAQISDFGSGGVLTDYGLRAAGRFHSCGTGMLLWMAPEVLDKDEISFATDIWSCGITCLELAYGRPPYSLLRPVKVECKM